MDAEADLALLGHIRDRITHIEEFTNRERSRFYDSQLVQDAMVRNLQTQARGGRARWIASRTIQVSDIRDLSQAIDE